MNHDTFLSLEVFGSPGIVLQVLFLSNFGFCLGAENTRVTRVVQESAEVWPPMCCKTGTAHATYNPCEASLAFQ